MLKSIKDDNDINFQKLPNNLNIELNGIQTLKPNLKVPNMVIIQSRSFLKLFFGKAFTDKLDKFKVSGDQWIEFFNDKDLMAKLTS